MAASPTRCAMTLPVQGGDGHARPRDAVDGVPLTSPPPCPVPEIGGSCQAPKTATIIGWGQREEAGWGQRL